MARPGEIFQWQNLSGNPVQIGDTTLTPQSRVLTVRSHFGGFVWNRPSAILIERGGHTERLPILDVTRIGLLAVVCLSVFVTIFVRAIRERSHQDERRV
jgi:hypothetical protein